MADRAAVPLRVALVLATSTGGVGRHVRGLARGLARRGHSVAVVGPSSTDQEFRFAQGFSDGEVRFRTVDIASGLPLLSSLEAARRLRRVTRSADVVHAHGVRAAAVAALGLGRLPVRRRRKTRPVFVITFHNAMLGSTFRRRVLRTGMAALARAADAVLAVSDDLVAQLRAAAPNVQHALVCADPPAFNRNRTEVRLQLGLAQDTPLVVAVGRLHHQKGFDVLIDAAVSLRATVSDAVVVIAGEGPQRALLEQKLLALSTNVRLLGHRDDASDLIRAADVVVMPSRWEGWPLAAAEVLAIGRPLVATEVGGLPLLVDDAAVLVPSGSAAALAKAIQHVLGDRAFAAELTSRAERRARELPGNDDVVDQVLAQYDKLLFLQPRSKEWVE